MEIFLKIETIPGECQDSNHMEWIELASFSHEIAQPTKDQDSVGSGKAPTAMGIHEDFKFSKVLDKATPKLNLACCNGSNVGDITVEVVRSIGDKIVFLKYEAFICHIANVSISGSPGDDMPAEDIAISYDKIQWTYTELDPKTHASKGDTVAHWDLTNRIGG